MRTHREQRYIVHLDIPATALDRSEAVQEALQQVRLGSLGNVVYRVETAETAEMLAAVPTQHLSSSDAPNDTYGDRCHEKYNRYPNEFLG